MPSSTEFSSTLDSWPGDALLGAESCRHKIQNYRADCFDTYNPIPNSPALAAQIPKDALGSGKPKISAKLWCDNMLSASQMPGRHYWISTVP